MTDEPIITPADDEPTGEYEVPQETYTQRLERLASEPVQLGPEKFVGGRSVGRIITVHTGTFTCRLCGSVRGFASKTMRAARSQVFHCFAKLASSAGVIMTTSPPPGAAARP
jgi:hypothetical protein